MYATTGRPMPRLGEFEVLVLLAVLRAGEQPYANRIRQDLEANAGRRVTRGALYRTIDRLVGKGFLSWELEPSDVPDRGGHPSRRLFVTDEGLAAVREARDVLATFLEGLDPLLDRA